MALKLARRGEIAPFIVMDVMRAAHERAVAGEDVLHLEVGQPGTQAPLAVREAAKRALDGEKIGYTDAIGISPLRLRIARHYAEWYGVEVDPHRAGRHESEEPQLAGVGEIEVEVRRSALVAEVRFPLFADGDRHVGGGDPEGVSEGVSQEPPRDDRPASQLIGHPAMREEPLRRGEDRRADRLELLGRIEPGAPDLDLILGGGSGRSIDRPVG